MDQNGSSLTEQWRSFARAQQSPARGFLLELPSGLKVRAHRPHLMQLLQTGRIPDTLTPRVHDLIAKAQSGGEAAVQAEMKREQATDPAGFMVAWTLLLDTVWLEAVSDPVFSRDTRADDESLPVAAVNQADKEFLFMWCQGVDQSVQDFRGRRARSLAAVGTAPDGDDLPSGPGDAVGDQSADG